MESPEGKKLTDELKFGIEMFFDKFPPIKKSMAWKYSLHYLSFKPALDGLDKTIRAANRIPHQPFLILSLWFESLF